MVREATKLLDAYPTNDLSKCRQNYEAATRCTEMARAVIKRNKWDEQADFEMSQCTAMLSPTVGRGLLSYQSIVQISDLLALQSQAQKKFAEPLAKWSESALEENYQVTVDTSILLCQLVLHSEFLVNDKLTSMIQPLLDQVDAVPTGELETRGECLVAFRGAVEQVQALRCPLI